MNTPSMAQMRHQLSQHNNPGMMSNIGVEEAIDMSPKMYMNPSVGDNDKNGVQDKGLPAGGIDTNPVQPGQQMQPPGPPGQTGQMPGQMGQTPGQPSQPPMGSMAPGPQSNILNMTRQGQAMNAIKPPGMAKGGSTSDMVRERMIAEGKIKPKAKMPHMSDGGDPGEQTQAAPRKRKVFSIMPTQHNPVKTPDQFTQYDASNPSIKSLAQAFDEAIKHHLSLSPEERFKNSVRANEMVGTHIGRNQKGQPKDLLGKNAKLIKSEKGGKGEEVTLPDGRGVETTGLALAPAFKTGKFDTCPNSNSCKEECLGKTSGNYFKLGGGPDLSVFKGPRLNSLKKTLAMMNDPHSFAVKLHDEISDAKAAAAQNGNHLGVRLNVLSDINPRVHKALMEAHPDVSFYDYTKNNTDPIAPNHHYTYSSTGVSQDGVQNAHQNWKQMRRRLDGGDNVAMAFSHKRHLPEEVHDEETGKKYKVIDGDTHDFRPLDIVGEGEKGVIVGLKNKKATGTMDNAHKESGGFFVKYDPQELKTDKGVYARQATTRLNEKGKPMLGDTIPQNKIVNIKHQGAGMIPHANDAGEE